MRTVRFFGFFMAAALLAGGLGCEEVPGDTGGGGGGTAGTGGGSTTSTETEDPFTGGTPIDVQVPDTGRVYVDLDAPAIVTEQEKWELAFEGQDVFTNGGVSGPAQGAAFGPFAAPQFLGDEVPEYPFLIEDKSGGAFLDWYDYDGSVHALYSRFHVHGVRRGGDVYKVQILGYYGDVQGAPVSAIYSLRLAKVTANGVEATEVIEGIDGTAGGVSGTEADPSTCLVLATGEQIKLTPDEALTSPDWDLCFRRDSVSVNGELGGPGGVEAVDLDRAAIATETLEEVMARTAQSELGRFDAVDHAVLSDDKLPWRGDRIVSAFSDKWIAAGSSPLAPEPATWLVVGADGKTPFFAAFEGFTGATAEHPGTVRLRVKHIGGNL